MLPSTLMLSRERPFLRLAAAVAVTLGLAAGASACSSGDQAQVVGVNETTVTTVAADPTVVVVATAKGKELEVVTTPPGVGAPSTTVTTAVPPKSVQAIPRVGLNSAGSRKTPDGWAFESPTYFENPLVMVVTDRSGDWLRVMLHARPNGMQGWVRADQVELTSHSYRMELNLSKFELTVYDGDEVIEQTAVVIGKDATPTPVGEFFLNEKVAESNPNGAFGPWILSTSGYSETLETFDGGLPVIAFHGTNQPNLIGTKASNGCIRMPNDVVTRLADTLPAGTAITIVAE